MKNLHEFCRNLGYAIVTLCALLLVTLIYGLGTGDLPSNRGSLMGIVGLGALVPLLLRFTAGQGRETILVLLQHALVFLVLAVTVTADPVLRAPEHWNDLLRLSAFGAAIFAGLYQLVNAYQLLHNGRVVSWTVALAIVLIPFVFGGLLILLNGGLVTDLANQLSFGILTNPLLTDFTGRLVILFLFNEVLVNAFHFLVNRKFLSDTKGHVILLLAAVWLAAAPHIADFASGMYVKDFSSLPVSILTVTGTFLSQGALWGEVFVVTGLLLGALRRIAPSGRTIQDLMVSGLGKGMVYSGVLITLVLAMVALVRAEFFQQLLESRIYLLFAVCGALVFPLCKTIIETFDGSQSFFQRSRRAYAEPVLYVRGVILGLGMAFAVNGGISGWSIPQRAAFGAVLGWLIFGGVSVLRDAAYGLRRKGRVHTWRMYAVEGLLGAFIGAALCFYLDHNQLLVIKSRILDYCSFGAAPQGYERQLLLSKWGTISLGTWTGGAKLLFLQSLFGVLVWGVAAWLFAVNKAFLSALFQRDWWPVKRLVTRDGFAEMINNTIFVMRWGLWMSPIIFTFLWQMDTATWYNQDGAIRSCVAIFNDATMTPAEFAKWSVTVFGWVLAYDFFRVLIWLDHMGLRVASLVNLSFIGMDKLDEKAAKFVGKSASARFIPEGIKRFMTWAPLLIPYYIPAGASWDLVWNQSSAIQGSTRSLIQWFMMLDIMERGIFVISVVVILTLAYRLIRIFGTRKQNNSVCRLANSGYSVSVAANGEINSQFLVKGYDVTRRAYEKIDPAGRILFLAEEGKSWPVAGNYPDELFPPLTVRQEEDSILTHQQHKGISTTTRIFLPDPEATAELWEVSLENITDVERTLTVSPYVEWVLNSAGSDRGHTQYNRLFPEMEYVANANAVIAQHRYSKHFGFLAAQQAPQGFLTGRVDFIGRARSVWQPRALETLAFDKPLDTKPYPTFDPIAALAVSVKLPARSKTQVCFLLGCTKKREDALKWIKQYLKPIQGAVLGIGELRQPLIGHGEIPANTPQPYYQWLDNGKTLRVLTPYTPRPFDHTMSNPLGHVLCVTNRGLHTTANGNAQQNRLTPDWADTVSQGVPSEAFYLYEPANGEWFSPTYFPLFDKDAKHEADFSVDGSAVFRMEKSGLATELTTFVPLNEPVGLYLLKITNKTGKARELRVAPYFQIALADNPENAGKLEKSSDADGAVLFFTNPRNNFRSGPAFAKFIGKVDISADTRGAFFGDGRSTMHPLMVEQHKAANGGFDSQNAAAFVSTVQVPANGEVSVAVMLGQADDMAKAYEVLAKYDSLVTIGAELQSTRKWWLALMATLEVETNKSDVNAYLNWLKYQALAERIWARKGFYQASGAFGFRDQLQDTVNMIWVDPALARQQLILNASHQFIEGDVVHWFFRQQDGRSGFLCRSNASDNLLWLGWGVGEYVRMTGDETLLDECTSYLRAETPLPPLPQMKHGMGFYALRSTREDSIYEHCLKAFDLVFDKKTGRNNLPLIGTGDWNDGLDEIGSQGRGESVWLGLFLHYILTQFIPLIVKRDGEARANHYREKQQALGKAIEKVWRGDRYLRAIHDDGTEIGVKDSGIWEIDALTAAWAVMANINSERARKIFDTAISALERDNVILLGTPALRADSKPYLGRSCEYPEGVRENGMYSHGVQWLVRAARLLSERFAANGQTVEAGQYRATAFRLWYKISALSHMADGIEIYGGQPNKQAADKLTTFDQGRMIWNGYTGAAAWMLRQACEGVLGVELRDNDICVPEDFKLARGGLEVRNFKRELSRSPLAK